MKTQLYTIGALGSPQLLSLRSIPGRSCIEIAAMHTRLHPANPVPPMYTVRPPPCAPEAPTPVPAGLAVPTGWPPCRPVRQGRGQAHPHPHSTPPDLCEGGGDQQREVMGAVKQVVSKAQFGTSNGIRYEQCACTLLVYRCRVVCMCTGTLCATPHLCFCTTCVYTYTLYTPLHPVSQTNISEAHDLHPHPRPWLPAP